MLANPMANVSHLCQEMRDCTMGKEGKRTENALLNVKKKEGSQEVLLLMSTSYY